MSAFAQSPFRALASLRLTVVCLALGMLLVFLGTLAQVHQGIHAVQAIYFQSLFVFWSPNGASWKIPVLPGGYLLGCVLLVNLIAAHATRFQLTRKKAGIICLHLGVILLLIGQLLTGVFARETQMRIDEGQTLGYSEAAREVELAVIDTTNPDYDQVVAIPEKILAQGGIIQNPALPFTLQIKRFVPNARMTMRTQTPDAPPSGANIGVGPNVAVQEVPRTVKDDERDLSAALVEVNGVNGSLGTWLVSNAIPEAQSFTLGERTFELVMRQRRFPKPFTLTLLDFKHDLYAGTDIPKNFSSRIRLADPERGENRDVLISMNDPLRYRGFTFYQAGFDNSDKTTILQVVKNPAMLLPYIACGLVALGLTLQFGMHLVGFMKKAR
ncbi:MAG: cytochrome c biogenesis protein ResB [Verrucomicrobiota bacterium]|nr:cytochrome c biogenesis protein ResB [Verrucomicrobiota bacterium]